MKGRDEDLLAMKAQPEKFDENYEHGMNCCLKKFTFADIFKSLIHLRKKLN